jgi:WD40 repeat protein
LLLGEQATRQGIINTVNEIINTPEVRSDSVIFYFSGHGSYIKSNGQSENLLVPVDGSIEQADTLNIKVSQIQAMLEGSPFRQKFMFIDACRNELVTGNLRAGMVNEGFAMEGARPLVVDAPELPENIDLMERLNACQQASGIKVIYSTAEGYFSRELADLNHGLFSFYLIRGMKTGEAADQYGFITIGGLESYINRKMLSYSHQYNAPQRPMSAGEGSTDMMLAYVVWDNLDFTQAVDPLNRLDKPIMVRSHGAWKKHSNKVVDVAVAPNGHTVVSASQDGMAHIWNLASQEEIGWLMGTDKLTCVAVSPDSSFVAVGCENGEAYVYSLSSRQLVMTLTEAADEISDLEFSPDSRHLVVGSHDATVRMYTLATGVVQDYKEHEKRVNAIDISPDGRWIASVSQDTTGTIWPLGNRDVALKLEGHSREVFSIAFSPDNVHLATGAQDGTIIVWRIDTGAQVATLNRHERAVNKLVYNADGSRLYSAGFDPYVVEWDVATGKHIRTLDGHDKPVKTLAISKDGQYLLTGSADKTARLWELSSGLCAAVMSDHGHQVNAVAFSPDGHSVVTGSYDNTAITWEIVDL